MRSHQNIGFAFGDASATQVTASIDTIGFRFATISFCSSLTDSATMASKIEQSDDNSTFVAIPNCVTGTDWSPSTGTNETTVAKIVFEVSMLGKKRFLKVTGAQGRSARLSLHAHLHDPIDGISSDTDANAAVRVIC
jgi:hypothetical protein